VLGVSAQTLLSGFSRPRGKDNHRNLAKVWIGLQFRQNISPIFPWKIEVQKDQIGPGSMRIFAGATNEIEGLYAVLNRVDIVQDLCSRKASSARNWSVGLLLQGEIQRFWT
jgi:hypothetical protein